MGTRQSLPGLLSAVTPGFTPLSLFAWQVVWGSEGEERVIRGVSCQSRRGQ